MIISLVGMSGTGKSYWAHALNKDIKFIHFCCDDLIEQKLYKELIKFGYSGINDVAKWMGQPYDPQYIENSNKYLDFERNSMLEIFSKISNNLDKNIVIDTTGSIIYMDNEILDILKSISKVVYLSIDHDIKESMYNLYIREPKPVIWGNIFNKCPGESKLDALKRCYFDLLNYRIDCYKAISHISLDYKELKSSSFDSFKFLATIKRKLKLI